MAAPTVILTIAFTILNTFFFQNCHAIIGGTTKNNPCDFPGLAAVVLKSLDFIMCHGIIDGDELVIPKPCFTVLLVQSFNSPVVIHYGNGLSYTIPTNGIKGKPVNGTYRIDISRRDKNGPCSSNATIFDAAKNEIVPDTCQMVSYGVDIAKPTPFDSSNLKSANVTKSTSVKCCEKILPTFSNVEAGTTGTSDNVPRNCLKAEGTGCGIVDTGAPIYCDTKVGGEKVVIGLVGSTPCAVDNVFTAIDLTKGSEAVKFGIPK